MAYLPPTGWADLATTNDLVALRADIANLDLKLEATEHRIVATLRAEMAAQTRTFMFSTISILIVLASTILAAAKL